MNLFKSKCIALLLTGVLFLSPALASLAMAQASAVATPSPADPDEVDTIHHLARAAYLGDQKDAYLAENLTEEQITDALLVIDKRLESVKIQDLAPGNQQYSVEDLKSLQALVQDKAEEIRARKVSSWRFDNKLKKMIAALSAPAAAAPVAAIPPTQAPTASPTPAPPTPTATPTPIPGPTKQEFDALKATLQDLSAKTGDMQKNFDLKMADLSQNNSDLQKAGASQKEEMELVKKLLDRVQGDLQKTDARLEQVAQKAEEKNVSDTELEQELTIMHKDIRDNVQDVSVLKQEVAKLDKSGEVKGENVLDQILDSKWLAGGALVIGLGALVVALTRK